MRVLFINTVCGSSSTGRIVAELADKFTSEGHEAKIAYGRSYPVPERYRHYAVRVGSKFDEYYHALMTRLTDKHALYSRNATRKFLKWADEYNPDLLWLHNIHGYFINIELLFEWIKSKPGLKKYWTLHDCWPFTGHCAYFTAIHCDKWKTHCEHCPIRHSPPASYADNSYENFEIKKKLFTCVQNLTLITPSQWLADLTRESFLKEYPVEVRHNTINTNIFRPTQSTFREEHNLAGKFIIMGCASAWAKRKGLDDFVRLSEILDTDKFAIVLIGLNRSQIKAMPPHVIALGRTESPQQLAGIYTASNVFFNPTYEENYPTVNLEAEACGTPVITYDTGGCPETIRREDSSIIPCGDLDEAVRLIKKKQALLWESLPPEI